MRHAFNVLLLTGLAFLLCIMQYFITNVYGKIMFWPILILLINSYVMYQIRPKVFRKHTDKIV